LLLRTTPAQSNLTNIGTRDAEGGGGPASYSPSYCNSSQQITFTFHSTPPLSLLNASSPSLIHRPTTAVTAASYPLARPLSCGTGRERSRRMNFGRVACELVCFVVSQPNIRHHNTLHELRYRTRGLNSRSRSIWTSMSARRAVTWWRQRVRVLSKTGGEERGREREALHHP